ncbi:ADP-ribosylglycohydrolase family protein [Marinicella meishanensis]|uniref:ADP-ribosylglycohydrolase family protein n=1 Tax=Marinicella meishanensis TaxID=2873263 RepID=UPI001CBF7772|nr:ADP-ribosylglycohydrolase family protein [Marinicella sp. NBU2979]
MDNPDSFSKDQFRGCLLGLACGDALCASYEGGILERALWRLIGKTGGQLRFTDDTQMALDIIHSINHCGELDQDHLAGQFARSYRWSRGYGPGSAKLLKSIKRGVDWRTANNRHFKNGSYGNGAAMRAPVLALFFQSEAELLAAAEQAAMITHAHPLGIEGAQLLAMGALMAMQQQSPVVMAEIMLKLVKQDALQQKLLRLQQQIEAQLVHNPKSMVQQYGNGMSAPQSCVTALATALQFLPRPYTEMTAFIGQMGGDADTIAAMAGAIWGAYHGYQAMQVDAVNTIEAGQLMIELADQVFINRHAVI